MKIKLLPFLILILSMCIYPQNQLWHKISTVDAGNSVSIAVDSLGYIYNGTSDRGLFQSTDNGLSWQKLNIGFSDITIRKVRVTQDGSIMAVTTKYGIMISSDNGRTWSQINGQLSPIDIITISSSSDFLLAGTPNGLFKSSDGGKNWLSDNAFAGLKVIEIENIKGTIFCYGIAGIQKKAFFTSSDGGKTWTEIDLSHEGFSYQTAAFAFDKATGRVFCAASFSSYNGTGRVTYSSNDNGRTWVIIDSKGKLINSLFTDSSGLLFAACSHDGIIKSTDWGLSWQNASAGISNPYVGSITYDKKGNIYAGTTSGVMVSQDNGLSWKEVSKGLNISSLNGFVADDNGNLYASSTASIYRSKDDGLNWAPVMNGIEPGNLSMLREVNNNIFISHTTYLTTSSFTSGQKFYPDLNSWGKSNNVVDQTGVDPRGRIYSLYTYFDGIFATNYLYVSSNGGDIWSPLLSTDKGGWNPPFAVDPYKGIIYLRSAGNLCKSSDYGKTWSNTNYAGGNCIKLKSNTKGHLFAMPDSFNIFRSEDEGNTWKDIRNNITLTAGISEIYFDNNNRVFLLTGNGRVIYSKNSGDSWIEITNNLLDQGGIFAIAFSPYSVVYAASISGEIYRTTEEALKEFVSVEEPKIDIPENYSLSQNYPNPFNPNTTISYAIPHAGNVSISLFDALGNKVMDLVNEYKSEGIYKVNFDGKNFASGVYFYRIHSGNYIETKKLMLIK
ncbi:MAG: T9SS type A sorting domain-containing protein [Ignavibacteria bacterium]|jgi:photosystem II stability/assembly factor-like uncharacterized protein|nr:T9SS type A sorting domain-containing protein [Ignavibacteria bacterium]